MLLKKNLPSGNCYDLLGQLGFCSIYFVRCMTSVEQQRPLIVFYYGERRPVSLLRIQVDRHNVNGIVDIPMLDQVFGQALRVYSIKTSVLHTRYTIYFCIYRVDGRRNNHEVDFVICKRHRSNDALTDLHMSDMPILEAATEE